MAIPVHCECGAVFEVRDEYAGKKGLCPTCGTQVLIPQPGEVVPPKVRSKPAPPPAPAPSDIYLEEEEEDDLPTRRIPLWAGFSSGFLGLNRTAGILLMFCGLCLVVISRGCDSTGNRSVARAAAQYQLVQNRFEDTWDRKMLPVESALAEARQNVEETEKELREERDKADPNQATIEKLQTRVEDYEDDIETRTEELDKLKREQTKEFARAAREDWRNYEVALRDASSGQRMQGWWLAWLFLGGTLTLILGLLTLAATGEGHEKLISLLMIGIITFSLYVGGAAWIDTVFSSVDSQETRQRAPNLVPRAGGFP